MSDAPQQGELVTPSGQWLPRLVAKQRLGISERTLDRRLQAGQLQRRTSASGQIEVFIPATPPSSDQSLTSHLADALAPLVARNATQEQQLVALAMEVGRLRAALAAAEARLALPPPRPDSAQSRWRRLLARLRPPRYADRE